MEKSLPINSLGVGQSSNTDNSKAVEETQIPQQLSDASIETASAGEDDYEYVTGFKLAIVTISVTLVAFLIMLDTSIISTVRLTYLPLRSTIFLLCPKTQCPTLVPNYC
jgi:hypothetical protein